MALTIWLKPGEHFMLNGALVENLNAHKVKLRFNNQVRILKQRDHFQPNGPMTSAEKVYYEAMLLSGGDAKGSQAELLKALARYTAPSRIDPEDAAEVSEACRDIAALAAAEDFYEAMIAARVLLGVENPTHPMLPIDPGA